MFLFKRLQLAGEVLVLDRVQLTKQSDSNLSLRTYHQITLTMTLWVTPAADSRVRVQ